MITMAPHQPSPAAQQDLPDPAGTDDPATPSGAATDPAAPGTAAGATTGATASGATGAAGASGTSDDAAEGTPSIDEMRVEIDAIDAELVRLIQRRTALSHAIGAARRSQGGPRIVYSREIQVLDRFRELGPAGTELGMLLLSLGRGTLGRK